MSFKVNNGHTFIHPVSGLFIGPGDFYDVAETAGVETTQQSEVLTSEEFAKLNAGEQSAMLKNREIEPGSNKEMRVQQYTEWLQTYTDSLQGQSGGSDGSGSADPNGNPDVSGSGSVDPDNSSGDQVNPDPEKGAATDDSSDPDNSSAAGAGGSDPTV